MTKVEKENMKETETTTNRNKQRTYTGIREVYSGTAQICREKRRV
jgi:hypothetical protein